ncbi:hypothetical protein [uncultured Allofournierella sp.]|uniref:hypothetical protein n=1 Tax=uncultured Allofournierella sp. TaxID=1940258 RepID=UPI0025E2BB03|nr:hypothetical protein [uncultured Fournierella sp.]
MTKNQDSMISYVLKYLSDKEKITEATIQDAVTLFLSIVPLNDSEQTEVIKELQARLQIDIDRGVYITAKDHKPWYAEAKPISTLDSGSAMCNTYRMNADGYQKLLQRWIASLMN